MSEHSNRKSVGLVMYDDEFEVENGVGRTVELPALDEWDKPCKFTLFGTARIVTVKLNWMDVRIGGRERICGKSTVRYENTGGLCGKTSLTCFPGQEELGTQMLHEPSKDKKPGKSGDIRSYFKAFGTSGSSSQASGSESASSSTGKRKAAPLSDEEDFSNEKKKPQKERTERSSKASASRSKTEEPDRKNKKPKADTPPKSAKPVKHESPKAEKKSEESGSRRKATESPKKKEAVKEEPSVPKKKEAVREEPLIPKKKEAVKEESSVSKKKEAVREEPLIPKKKEVVKEEPSSVPKKDEREKVSKNVSNVQQDSKHDSRGKDRKKQTDEGKSKNAKIRLPKGGYSRSKNLEIDRTVTTGSDSKKRSASKDEGSEEDNMPPPSKKKTKESSPGKVTPARKPRADSSASKTPESTLKTPGSTPEAKRAGYFKFLSRGGPKNLGAKEFPEGAPNCLANLAFVLSGVLPSFEKDDVVAVITKYGGRVTTAVSKKTSYLLIGDEAGATKSAKAKSLGVPIITEDDFLDLLRKSNPSGSTASTGNETAASESLFEASYNDSEVATPSRGRASISNQSLFEKSEAVEPSPYKPKDMSTPKKRFEDFHDFDSDLETPPKVRAKRGSKTVPVYKNSPVKDVRNAVSLTDKTEFLGKNTDKDREKSPKVEKGKTEVAPKTGTVKKDLQPGSSRSVVKSSSSNLSKQNVVTVTTPVGPPPQLWVEKYKPTSMKQLVGQAGDRSNAKKLLMWLKNWFQYHGSANDKAKANYPGLRDPDGKTFKAALLSGPPGVGKTTTANLCCKELGYDYYEMNASDQRNKKGLHEGISDSLSNNIISFPLVSKIAGQSNLNRKHVLIMDEVDGMSGNEDRGGVQELIALIKSSRIPIICICNDRNHQKIRSLANYCFDLRFTKPTFEQLKGFVQSVCFKEKIKLQPEQIQQLIKSTDQDVRQILHQLQMFKESDSKSVYDPRKDLRLGPWEVARKVFSSHDHQGMTINDKASLFFQDYNIGPLFVQENYLRSIPNAASGNPQRMMDLAKAAAESLALGDLVDNVVRRSNTWSLLPVQAIYSSVLPGEYMEGTGMLGIEFPQWLGKNSNRNKRARLLQELFTHVHLQISGNMDALNLDYLPYLRRSIVRMLCRGDIEEAAHQMTNYNLLREDFESLTELAMWPNMRDEMARLDSKSKATFTRLVNKESFVPYSIVKVTKAKKGAAAEEDLELEEGEGVEEVEEEEEDLAKDAMIKIKKPRAKPAPKSDPKRAKKGTSKRTKKVEDEDDLEIIVSDSEEEMKPKSKSRKSGSAKGTSKRTKKVDEEDEDDLDFIVSDSEEEELKPKSKARKAGSSSSQAKSRKKPTR